MNLHQKRKVPPKHFSTLCEADKNSSQMFYHRSLYMQTGCSSSKNQYRTWKSREPLDLLISPWPPLINDVVSLAWSLSCGHCLLIAASTALFIRPFDILFNYAFSSNLSFGHITKKTRSCNFFYRHSKYVCFKKKIAKPVVIYSLNKYNWSIEPKTAFNLAMRDFACKTKQMDFTNFPT